MKSRAHVIIFLLFTVIGILIIFYILFLNDLAIKGAVYQGEALRLQQLQEKDLLLEEQVLNAEAYTTIHRKALEQGYVDMTEVILY